MNRSLRLSISTRRVQWCCIWEGCLGAESCSVVVAGILRLTWWQAMAVIITITAPSLKLSCDPELGTSH
uniref:Uncharacterized protein n=1 Tax=Physcomitrium patens TaxID=3218 RepID=A0A2K1KVZ9_PHYPA|nr:hypothetical protein PHYPA_004920 [Physcomitrium patens]